MLGYEKALMLDPYELRVGMIADALYSVDTGIVIDTKFNLKDSEEKKIERILDCFYSVDRNFLEKKFRKKTNYIDECKSDLKKQYGIKGRQTLVNYLDKSMSGQESEKLYRVLDVYNFFEKTNKNYKTFAEALLDYYRLSDTEMQNDGDIEYLKEYYKKSFKLIFKYRSLLNKNGVLALDICKAVDIAKKGYICSYLTYDLVMEYIEGFGAVLIKEFSCWKDFYRSLILGFILEDFVKNPDLEYLSEAFDEKIRRIELALDTEISPCKYIKFRENPREDIDGLLRVIYNIDINEEVDIINKKMSIFTDEESFSFKEIKVREIEEVVKQNEVLEFKDDEYLLFAYPRKLFEDKKFKLSKYNSIFITNKRLIIFNKAKKDLESIGFKIEDMNIQKIEMKSKDLYYDNEMIFEDFSKSKNDTDILQFYFRELIFNLKFES